MKYLTRKFSLNEFVRGEGAGKEYLIPGELITNRFWNNLEGRWIEPGMDTWVNNKSAVRYLIRAGINVQQYYDYVYLGNKV